MKHYHLEHILALCPSSIFFYCQNLSPRLKYKSRLFKNEICLVICIFYRKVKLDLPTFNNKACRFKIFFFFFFAIVLPGRPFSLFDHKESQASQRKFYFIFFTTQVLRQGLDWPSN